MTLLDPANGPSGDLGGDPRRTYVIASTPRTGSTLLCQALGETGRIGRPVEYLNPMQLRDWEVRLGAPASRWRHQPLSGPFLALVGPGWTDARLRAHLDRVRARRTGPTGWFGLKLHAHHKRRWFGDGPLPLGDVTWIRVIRRDRVAQAVSWARALQTHQWATSQRPWREARYDRRAVEARIAAITRDEADWDRWIGGREALVLAYEDIAADLHGAVRAVYRALGEPDDVPPPTPRLARQGDDGWAARYRAGG